MLIALCLLFCFFSFIIFINKVVKRKCANQVPDLFDLANRNFDILVIGDYKIIDSINCQEQKKFVLTSPDRSFYASILIFERLHSLLREGQGKVIFVIRKKYLEQKSISTFDIPFLHLVTLNKLGINKRKINLPLLYEPYKSLKLLIYPPKAKIIDVLSYNSEIDSFCKERKIKYELIIIS